MIVESVKEIVGKNYFNLEVTETENGFSSNFGDWVKSKINSPEWQAAFTVYDKYHRSLSLEQKDLLKLRDFAESFSTQRQAAGKKVGIDILIQEISAFCKREFAL